MNLRIFVRIYCDRRLYRFTLPGDFNNQKLNISIKVRYAYLFKAKGIDGLVLENSTCLFCIICPMHFKAYWKQDAYIIL
jgi:hypothetical protein